MAIGCPDEFEFMVFINTPLQTHYRFYERNHKFATKPKPKIRSGDSMRSYLKELERLNKGENVIKQSDFPILDRDVNQVNWTEVDWDTHWKHKLPKELFFRTAVAMDDGVYRYYGHNDTRVMRELAKIYTHLQFQFHLPTLGVKITFDTPVPIVDVRGKWDCLKGKMVSENCSHWIRDYIRLQYPYRDHGHIQHTFGIVDSRNDGLFGIAAMTQICDPYHKDWGKRSMNKIFNPIVTPWIMAHELGHNLGFGHLHAGEHCGTFHFMGGGKENGWSRCHRWIFANRYNWLMNKYGYFCMERDNPKDVGGSWTRWGYWRCYWKDCHQYRYRQCVGYNCPGKHYERKRCYYWRHCGSPPCQAKN